SLKQWVSLGIVGIRGFLPHPARLGRTTGRLGRTNLLQSRPPELAMGNPEPSTGSGKPDVSPGALRPTRVRYAVLAAGCSMAFLAYLDRIGFGNYLAEI